MMEMRVNRRNVLRTIGTTTALGITGSSGVVAGEDLDVEIEKEELEQEKLTQVQEEVQKTTSLGKVVRGLSGAIESEIPSKNGLPQGLNDITDNHPTFINRTGYRISDSVGKSEYYTGALQIKLTDVDVLSEIIWTKTDEDVNVFGRIAGNSGELTESATVAASAADMQIPDSSSTQILVERYITEDSDVSIFTTKEVDRKVAQNAIPHNLKELEGMEYIGRINNNNGEVSIQSTSDFVDCVTAGAGGIVTGGGACAITCRDGCFKKPNYLGCLVCAGCAAVIACYLGSCGDDHLSDAFCHSAIANCASPVIGPGGCGVAYGCVIGNCGII